MSSNVQGLILSYGQKKQNDFGLIWDFQKKLKILSLRLAIPVI